MSTPPITEYAIGNRTPYAKTVAIVLICAAALLSWFIQDYLFGWYDPGGHVRGAGHTTGYVLVTAVIQTLVWGYFPLDASQTTITLTGDQLAIPKYQGAGSGSVTLPLSTARSIGMGTRIGGETLVIWYGWNWWRNGYIRKRWFRNPADFEALVSAVVRAAPPGIVAESARVIARSGGGAPA